MLALSRALFMLSVMLLSTSAGAITFESNITDDNQSSMWQSFEPESVINSPLKSVDYRISIGDGFDPLVDDIPESRISNDLDYRSTGMAIIQMHRNIGADLISIVEKYDLFVLDHLGGSAWLVRLSSSEDLREISADPSVRWSGVMQPGWRISEDLYNPVQFLSLVPAADLSPSGLNHLVADLLNLGAEEAWCGLHLCEVKGQMPLASIARDGRIVRTEPAFELKLTNSQAALVVGISEVVANTSLNLDGTGELISFTDTGIDQDHPDLVGRSLVYTQFGLDPSPADTNTGHGTHVAVTLAGDGNGVSRGMAPNANLVAYALEHDGTGVFGRLGSIYDMLRHAEQEGSRISVNAWGLNGNRGAYTADARSIDLFVNDNPDFLPIFSAGDDVQQNASMVLSPSTAKNVLSIGASTTSANGVVTNFSSQGPALDGRVKPDLVAPGVLICSGRAEEATIPAGWSCGSGTHSNGNDLYMSMTGSSQSTAVAGGSISLIRQFIREDAGISAPSSSLLKAVSINRALDLDTPDIPNSAEGWGQISVSNTVMPMSGETQLTTYHDNLRYLDAGFSSLYAFDLDPSHGLDVTLVWSDAAGSASGSQSESRLVNDLDLTLTSPDGTVYKGNVFASGQSIPLGVYDSTNNVERIRFATGTSALPSGQWQISVSHTGGLTQGYSLVVTGDLSLIPSVDLATFNGSIFPSSESPLVNDFITLRMSWINQGTIAANSFRVLLEDLTTGSTLYDGIRSTQDAGSLDSVTIYHSFETTGDHQMRLTVDADNQVTEMNDENNGTNNNIHEMIIPVSALGVRLVTLDSNGLEDPSLVNRTMDPTLNEGLTWPIILKHEGTAQQEVKLHLSQVQKPHPVRDDILLPTEDDWSRNSDPSGPFTMSPIDSLGDKMYLNVTLNDDDADLSGTNPRYAMAGTYLMDLTAKYVNDPTVSHSIRLKIIVDEVKDVVVAPAGTDNLEAEPGTFTAFSISVMNTGNTQAVYDLDCYSQNRWEVQLGQSNSSSYSFEPLEILEYLPMQVRLYVPPVVNGLPAAGTTDTITCAVTSSTDLELNISETVTLTVKALQSFDTRLIDHNGGDIPAASLAGNLSVDTAERLNLSLEISNTGNQQLDLEIVISPERTDWTIQVRTDSTTADRTVNINIGPGQKVTVEFEVLVSPTAQRDETNRLVIKTSQSPSNFVMNETTLVVKDELALELTPPDSIDVLVDGQLSYAEYLIYNSGNSVATLEWSHSLEPDGWTVNFVNPPLQLSPREERVVQVGLIAPSNADISNNAFTLGVYLLASNQYESIDVTSSVEVGVLGTRFANLSTGGQTNLVNTERGGSSTQTITVTNDGNQPLEATLSAKVVDDSGNEVAGWTIELSKASVELVPGETEEITLTLNSKDSTKTGLVKVEITAETGQTTFVMEIDASVESRVEQAGLLENPIILAIFIAVVLLVGIVAVRMKISKPANNYESELVAPGTHSAPDDGVRREAVMDSISGESMTGGSVSAEEIAVALSQSIPSLPGSGVVPSGRPPTSKTPEGKPPVIPDGRPPAIPTGRPPAAVPVVQQPIPPPLPPGGLPPGWTHEQWKYYGHQWLSQQGQQ
ncbi:MAG: S8 family serine peptidase [Candidatus Poseidoniaceae archaeon]|nr:S8 family serine peptidase [Candidatus Poseidoniaceae archaeon]